ncbi:MAG: hypothetical protein J0H82_04585 [Alphaproteobacteria bacterium]|jgi:hypothetical protein|nr:hypothetical protein [Alphaproteobacteria bacterium]
MAIFAPVSEYLVLVTLQPLDRATGLRTTVRLADRHYTTGAAETPANAEFLGLLVEARIEGNLVAPGRTRGGSVGARGSLAVADPSADVGAGRKLGPWRGYRWQYAPVTIDLLAVGRPIAEAVRVFSGQLGDVTSTGAEWRMPLRDRQADWSRRKLLTARYDGFGGFGGVAALADRYKPRGWGLARQVPAVMVDPANLWLDLHSGPIDSIVGNGYDGGAQVITPSASNPPPSGSFYVDAANGRVRLGVTPTFDATFDVRLDVSGGVYVATHAGILRRLAVGDGGLADPAGLVTASFAALDAALPDEIGLWFGPDDDPDLAEVCDRIAESYDGWWILDRDGRLDIGRWTPPTATAATAALVLDERDVVAGTLQRIATDPPPPRLTGRYRRYAIGGRDRSRLAGAVSEAAKLDLAQEWRQVTWESTALATEYPGAEPLDVELLHDGRADAQAEIDRRGAGLVDSPWMLGLQTGMQAGALRLGQQVWISHPDEDLDAGKAFICAGWRADLLAGLVDLELWRDRD